MPTKGLILTSIAPGTDELTVTLSEGKNYTGAEVKLGVEVSVLPKADPVFENNSWETIAAYAAAGKAKDTWSIGDEKAFTIGSDTYHMQIIDFDHNILSDAESTYNGGIKKAAITLCMKEIYRTTYKYANANYTAINYPSMAIYDTINVIKGSMDASLVSVIKNVVVQYMANNNKSISYSNVINNVFILSGNEIYGDGDSREGTQYSYFKNTGSRVKKRNGVNEGYWTRTPRETAESGGYVHILCIGSSGTKYFTSAVGYNGVVLCCCI